MKERIFISSVQKELAAERRAIRDFVRGDALLGQYFEVFLFEDAPAGPYRLVNIVRGGADVQFHGTDPDHELELTALVDQVTTVTVGTPSCPGDATGDGAVDIADLLATLEAWGPCAGCGADLDGSGEVDVADLLEVLGHWGAGC